MDAQLQGLLIPRPAIGPRQVLAIAAIAAVALLTLPGCAMPDAGVSGQANAPAIGASGTSSGAGPGTAAVAEATDVKVVPQEPAPLAGLGPEILLPAASGADEDVARVGDLTLRQSQAFARLMVADPKLARLAVDLLVFDVLVGRHAQQHGIRVEPATVEELALAEERRMQQQVERELASEMDFPAYVFAMFGMRLEAWRRTLRLRTAQRLYQGYVIRYLALREDRVLVRFLMHRDRKVAEEVCEKVRDGADFATLALRWSEDGRRDGGLLPAFGRGFPHPVAEPAFALQKGAVSEPFEREIGGESRWFVVYCLNRFAGRDEPFSKVRDELDRDLRERPLTQLEMSAYTLRWRGESERAAGPGADRAENGR
ncbi:MAG: peptidylprolyl isomerase [bacterium]|nr:peptidylprolyl isomerase [bacterium]